MEIQGDKFLLLFKEERKIIESNNSSPIEKMIPILLMSAKIDDVQK